MHEKTETAKIMQSLALNPEAISKDKQSKIALRNPVIMAYIAKQVVPEFKNKSLHEIVKRHFVGEPFVRMCELPEDAPQLMGVGTESRDINHTDSNFDVCEVLLLNPDEPDEEKKKFAVFNIEPQNKFYTPYALPARQIVYAARLLSAQLPSAPANYAYAHLSKVYSIWVLFDPSKSAENSITILKPGQECTDGDYRNKPESYDLFEIWQVMLGTPGENNGPNRELLDFLDVLFSKTLPLEERLGYMENKGITLNREEKETMKVMTEEMLRYETETFKRGYEDGESKKLKECVIALNGVLSPEIIAEKFGMPLQQVLDTLAEAGEK